jgi:signal transduction histidine kinase
MVRNFGFLPRFSLLVFSASWSVSPGAALARLVGDELDLEQMEAGRAQLHLVPTDLNESVLEVVNALRPTTTHHQFVTDLEPGLPIIAADADQVVRIVTNLVANAVKYAPEDRAITIRSMERSGELALTVADQRLGVPPANRESIFTRYGRIERPEVGHSDTGLGLPITRHLVELHGGQIWVEDNVPRGSVISVVLPIAAPIGR